MPVHDPSSESFDWETIFKSSDRCGETVARTCLFAQRRTSQVSYYNISAHNVYYVKCNVVLNNVIFDSCLFPHQHYDRHSFHARECCAIRQNVRGDKSSMAFNNHFAHYSLFSTVKAREIHSATPAACTVRHILLLLHFLTERVTGCQMKCSFDSAPPAVCINRA